MIATALFGFAVFRGVDNGQVVAPVVRRSTHEARIVIGTRGGGGVRRGHAEAEPEPSPGTRVRQNADNTKTQEAVRSGHVGGCGAPGARGRAGVAQRATAAPHGIRSSVSRTQMQQRLGRPERRRALR